MHLIRLVLDFAPCKGDSNFDSWHRGCFQMPLMRCFHSSRSVLSAGCLALLAAFAAPAALAAEVFVTQTNWVDRPITNVIEVRMPKNIFISQYHTNWVSEFRTNVISVFETNRSQIFLTNRVMVQLARTNLVTAYRTNFETLNLTNWETVQVLKTNWIRRPATNVVKIDAPLASPPVASSTKNSPAALPPVASSTKNSPVGPSVAAASGSADALAVETARPPVKIGNAQWEVQLRVRSGKNAAGPVVQRWRVEHLEAGVLNFKQGQVLTLELTPGRYQIEAMLQGKAATPVQVLRALLAVTPDAAVLQPSSGKSFASASD